ncbi:universal stress protein [Natrialbaceae archaeon A-chndr2]
MVIVAAVDQSNRADIVIEEANSLAKAFDDTVHVLHVMTQSEFVNMGRTAANNLDDSFSMEQVRETAAEIAADAATNLEVPSEAVGKMGDPADTIVKYAEENQARYIVVAPRKRSPTGKAVFGSAAQSILLNSEIPVLSSISR